MKISRRLISEEVKLITSLLLEWADVPEDGNSDIGEDTLDIYVRGQQFNVIQRQDAQDHRNGTVTCDVYDDVSNFIGTFPHVKRFEELENMVDEKFYNQEMMVSEVNAAKYVYQFTHDFWDGENPKSRVIDGFKECKGNMYGEGKISSIKMFNVKQSSDESVFGFSSNSLEDLKKFKERLTHSWNELEDEKIVKKSIRSGIKEAIIREAAVLDATDEDVDTDFGPRQKPTTSLDAIKKNKDTLEPKTTGLLGKFHEGDLVKWKDNYVDVHNNKVERERTGTIEVIRGNAFPVAKVKVKTRNGERYYFPTLSLLQKV